MADSVDASHIDPVNQDAQQDLPENISTLGDTEMSGSSSPSSSGAGGVRGPRKVHVKVKMINRPGVELDVDRDTTIEDLKKIIEDAVRVDPSRQRLIFTGRVLKNEKTLRDYGISDGHTIHLVVRPENMSQSQNDSTSSQAPSASASVTSSIPMTQQVNPGVFISRVDVSTSSPEELANLDFGAFFGNVLNTVHQGMTHAATSATVGESGGSENVHAINHAASNATARSRDPPNTNQRISGSGIHNGTRSRSVSPMSDRVLSNLERSSRSISQRLMCASREMGRLSTAQERDAAFPEVNRSAYAAFGCLVQSVQQVIQNSLPGLYDAAIFLRWFDTLDRSTKRNAKEKAKALGSVLIHISAALLELGPAFLNVDLRGRFTPSQMQVADIQQTQAISVGTPSQGQARQSTEGRGAENDSVVTDLPSPSRWMDVQQMKGQIGMIRQMMGHLERFARFTDQDSRPAATPAAQLGCALSDVHALLHTVSYHLLHLGSYLRADERIVHGRPRASVTASCQQFAPVVIQVGTLLSQVGATLLELPRRSETRQEEAGQAVGGHGSQRQCRHHGRPTHGTTQTGRPSPQITLHANGRPIPVRLRVVPQPAPTTTSTAHSGRSTGPDTSTRTSQTTTPTNGRPEPSTSVTQPSSGAADTPIGGQAPTMSTDCQTGGGPSRVVSPSVNESFSTQRLATGSQSDRSSGEVSATGNATPASTDNRAHVAGHGATRVVNFTTGMSPGSSMNAASINLQNLGPAISQLIGSITSVAGPQNQGGLVSVAQTSQAGGPHDQSAPTMTINGIPANIGASMGSVMQAVFGAGQRGANREADANHTPSSSNENSDVSSEGREST